MIASLSRYRLKAAAIVERIPVCFGPDAPHYAEWKEVKDRLAVCYYLSPLHSFHVYHCRYLFVCWIGNSHENNP
jgi:hypothetical protein